MSLKNVLEWVFAAVSVVIVCIICVSRVLFLRGSNRPLREFFACIEAPQRGGSSQGSMRPGPVDLALTPLNRQGRERTQATDIDPEGRRGGGPDPDDTSGDLTGKEILPAYEVKGGPPNYSQLLAVDLGTSTNARLEITETMPVGRSPRSQSLEAYSGTSNFPAQTNPTLVVQLPHPPPPSYIPGSVVSHSDNSDIHHSPADI